MDSSKLPSLFQHKHQYRNNKVSSSMNLKYRTLDPDSESEKLPSLFSSKKEYKKITFQNRNVAFIVKKKGDPILEDIVPDEEIDLIFNLTVNYFGPM